MSSLDYKEDARDLHAFKELRFFLSHSVPLEIRCGVARLELPLVADYLLGGGGNRRSGRGADYGNNKQQEKQEKQKRGLALEVGIGGSDDDDDNGKMAEIVSRIVSEPELVATCQLFSDGQPMHKVAMSSHTPSRYDPRQHAIVWDDSLCFPVRYRDLDRNSQLVVVLRGAKDRLVGVASMRFFDANGSLNMGLQKRPFLFTDKAPFSWDPAAPPSGREPGENGVWCSSGGISVAGSNLWEGDGGGDDGSDGVLSKDDLGFALERMRERFRLGAMDRADWLDPVSLQRVDRLVAALANPDELRKYRAYQTDAEASLRDSPNLVLEMPCFAHPVIHEERPYPGVPGGGGGGAGGAGGTAGMVHRQAAAMPTADGVTTTATVNGAAAGEAGGGRGGMGEGGRSWGASDLLAGGGSDAFLLVSDYEMEEDNPVEQKYRKLAHDQLRGLVDPELKPNRDERHRIDDLVAGRQDHLSMQDKDLLWKFRYCLTDNKRALTKLLLSVDWGVDSEVAQVDGLLAEWAQRAPIDAPDALKLLGRERTFQAEVVRRFAVDALRRASDDELLAFLLQLVQALRYQQAGAGGAGPGAGGDGGEDALGGGGGDDGGRGGGRSGGGGTGGLTGTADGGGGDGGGVSPLAQFLIERACKSLKLANFFYWYLKVELEDATHGHIYRAVQAAFQRAMSRTPESAGVLDKLLAQDHYFQAVAQAHQEACDLNGRKWAKDERLRTLLKAPNLRRVPKRSKSGGGGGGGMAGGVAEALLAEFGGGGGGGGGSVPMPVDPTVQITGLEPSSAFLFKSALYPCVIEFMVKREATSSGNTADTAAEAAAGGDSTVRAAKADGSAAGVLDEATGSTPAVGGAVDEVDGRSMDGGKAEAAVGAEEGQGGTSVAVDGGPSLSPSSWLGHGKPKETSYKVIFKSGDDLRQDQLIMQMISLMDSLLKRVNLDLKLKPYGILATGPRTGLVEFVSGSQPVSAVLSAHNKSILEYLRHHNPDPSAPNGVKPAAVQTFVKSTAGYCVITYLLGIGDRHLDNIMMLPTGNLFHIDFGYIFGRDPKPGATPIRFTREMADAMGGVDSEEYRKFKTYCCQAFNWLRKSANLILNLLSLMSDAGISDLSDDPVAALAKVEDNFRLDLTDEMAENLFLRLIDTSLQAFAPRVMEVLHRVRVAGR